MAKELVLINNIWTLRQVPTPSEYYKLIYDTDRLTFAEATNLAPLALQSIRTPISGTIS